MKELMLGNKAIARGLYEAGVKFVSSYPGTPSTEITEEVVKFDDVYAEWAPNEKVAMESAFGASLAGRRAFCAQKHVGLNVAADPLYTMSYTGVNAGLVIVVADDAGMHSSQNEQDSRRHAIAAKVPMLEPADSKEALEFTKLGFEISEKFDTPVLIKMCTRVAHSQSIVETGERKEFERPYEKNIAKYVMMPGNAKKRHPIVEERTKKLAEFAETSTLNRIETGDTKLGIITASTSYQYVKEVFGDTVSVLKLGMTNPLPEKLIKDFATKVDRLVVVEELDPIIEEAVKAMGIKVEGANILPRIDEFSPNIIRKAFNMEVKAGEKLEDAIPPRPPVMCAGCPHRGMFYTLKKLGCTVLGDIGCYTLGAVPPLAAMDITLCMGASIGALHGFTKVNKDAANNTVAVIGDSTFIHSGMTGLANVAYNQSNGTVIILDNSITGMTGHQQNPATGKNIKGEPAGRIDLEALCRAMGFNRVRVVDPYNLKETETAVKEELAADESSVIISRRPCALLKEVKHNAPLAVDKDKCIGCKSCMRIGCPAISIRDKKAVVDANQCVGCGICEQLCPKQAFAEASTL
ncbi:MAG: indolepyruvate ferredoxin oxidoreductase subunit alpha [Selenomonadaceae bacterium]|nr:indolepyruvate ferredoxin oxidoreductase subunit alpha [Selenomonadaceae bacterium]